MPRAPSDKLIDQIYDAAIEPQLWDRVLVEIADMLSSVRGARNRYADQRLQGGFNHFGHLAFTEGQDRVRLYDLPDEPSRFWRTGSL